MLAEMDEHGSSGQSSFEATPTNTIRFAGDSELTFVNYGSGSGTGFAYRPEARLHNARRRLPKHSRNTPASGLPPRQERRQNLVAAEQPLTLVDPLSTFARDPFSQYVLTSRQKVEDIWRSVFPNYFYLPNLITASSDFQNPADFFLNAARTSRNIYRSLVVQAVVTTEANRGNQADEAVYRNQALIIRDFRKMVDTYSGPDAHLSGQQLQNVFGSAWSLSSYGFDKEAGYNATAFVNSLFMTIPHNQAVKQTPICDWIQLTMPRAGPSFNWSEAIALNMLRKINLVLDFVENVQANLDTKFSDYVSRYVRPTTALYQIITSDLPDQIIYEPYPGFHLICFFRVLSLLYRHFDCVSQSQTEAEETLPTIEALASTCLENSSPQHIALFLWRLISNARNIGLHDDQDGPFVAWAMKELIAVESISFVDEMVAWLLRKCRLEDDSTSPTIQVSRLRERFAVAQRQRVQEMKLKENVFTT